MLLLFILSLLTVHLGMVVESYPNTLKSPFKNNILSDHRERYKRRGVRSRKSSHVKFMHVVQKVENIGDWVPHRLFLFSFFRFLFSCQKQCSRFSVNTKSKIMTLRFPSLFEIGNKEVYWRIQRWEQLTCDSEQRVELPIQHELKSARIDEFQEGRFDPEKLLRPRKISLLLQQEISLPSQQMMQLKNKSSRLDSACLINSSPREAEKLASYPPKLHVN